MTQENKTAILEILRNDELIEEPAELSAYSARKALLELFENWDAALRDGYTFDKLIGDIDDVTRKLQEFKSRALERQKELTVS